MECCFVRTGSRYDLGLRWWYKDPYSYDRYWSSCCNFGISPNYVGYIPFVVHTPALRKNDVFTPDKNLSDMTDQMNRTMSYINQHQKPSSVQMEKQKKISNDRLKRLKHYVPTLWQSWHGSMCTYPSQCENTFKTFGLNRHPDLGRPDDGTLAAQCDGRETLRTE